MAINNIAIRFTDEVYATKSDLSEALGISSIDSFWRNILSYRAQYQRKIGLKNRQQVPFYVTFSPTINQNLNRFISKVSKLDSKISTLNDKNLISFRKEKTIDSLRSISVLEGKKIGELSLRAMVNGTYKESNADHTSILNYRNAFKEFVDKPALPFNEDFLAKYYSLLLDEEELTMFYRSTDLDDTYKFKTTILGRDYDYAQADTIPTLMEEFFEFTQTGGGDPFAKSIMALYYFDYIKPFNSYNRELGCLVAKSIMSSFGYENASSFIAFEDIFKDSTKYSKLSLETQRSADLTYVVLYALSVIEQSIDKTMDLLTQLEVDAIAAEQFAEEKPAEVNNIPEKVEEVKSGTDEKNVSAVPVSESFTKEVSTSVPASSFSTNNVVSEEKIAIKPIVNEMSEKEMKEYAKYITEVNPSIRYTQAYFFATHSAMGHYYSIQDYKKQAKCVYETARTSMDNLAAEGFYKKLKIKNKFVYTPIEQERK